MGGRLGAYREGLTGEADADGFEAALVRNLYRGEYPGDAALAHSTAQLRALHGELAQVPLDALLVGRLTP